MIDKPEWLTLDLLRRMKQEVDLHPSRAEYVSNAPKFRNLYNGARGLQGIPGIDDIEIDDRQATARRNYIGEIVDEVESLFLKNWPIVRRTPYRPEDADLADVQDAIWLGEWRDSNGQAILGSMVHDTIITGLSIGKIVWNPYAKISDRDGAIAVFPLSENAVRVDPYAKNYARGRDVRYIIHTTRQPRRVIRRRYEDEGPVALGDRSSRGRKSKKTNLTFGSESPDKDAAEVSGAGEIVDAMEDVDEYWLFPQTMGFSELTTGDTIASDEYKYGLVVTVVCDHIVRVMKNPFVSRREVTEPDEMGFPRTRRVEVGHRRHPFIFLYWKRKTDEGGAHGVYDCLGMVQWMELMQFNINAIRRNIAINARTTANPPIAVNEDMLDSPISGAKWGPSDIIRVSQNIEAERAVKMLAPGQMPSYVFSFLAGEEQGIRDTASVKAGVSGLFPQPGGGTSHTPAATIGTLQESAFGPLWKYVAELGMAILDMSILYDGLIQQKYKPGRYIAKSRAGAQMYIEWTARHITAQFNREVVAGATTPLYDIDKIQRLTAMKMIVDEAMMSGDPRLMRSAILHLQNMDDPWRWDYVEFLEKELQRAETMQQQTQGMGLEMLMQGQQQGQQQGLPQGGGVPQFDTSGIEAMAEETGRTAEEILMALEGAE